MNIMKKIMSFVAVSCVILLLSCSKETDSNNLAIRYDFTATMAGNYNFETVTDTIHFSETKFTSNWSKIVNVQRNNAATNNAEFTVYPPYDWLGTDNEADVTLKIFINNVQKASVSGHFTGIDRPVGVTVSTTY
jgi:hypothetical protein